MNNESIFTRSTSISPSQIYPDQSAVSPDEFSSLEKRDSFSEIFDAFDRQFGEADRSNQDLKREDDVVRDNKDEFRKEDSVVLERPSEVEERPVAEATTANSTQPDKEFGQRESLAKEGGENQAVGQKEKSVDVVDDKKNVAEKGSSKDEDAPKLSSAMALKLSKGDQNLVSSKKAGKNVDQKVSLETDPTAKVKATVKDSDKKVQLLEPTKADSLKVGVKQAEASKKDSVNTAIEGKTFFGKKPSGAKPNVAKGEEKNVPQAKVDSKVKKGTAKTARPVVSGSPSPVVEDLKKSLNVNLGRDLNASDTLNREIGIKGASQSSDQVKPMFMNTKDNSEKATDKGFLNSQSDPVQNTSRAQAVHGRSETSHGSFQQQSHSGSQDHQSSQRENVRQWMVGNSEARANGQAVQQTQFVDRTVSSQLSTHVLNQIVNHIEKMREGDKNRLRVSLGSGDAGSISVDIRIRGGSITTSFEGDEVILDELKRDWRDISDKASQRGVDLSDPEFISYSSPVKSEFSSPDSGFEKEEKSQSVIQHKDNQPVRPVLQTATSGGSGPVHLYA